MAAPAVAFDAWTRGARRGAERRARGAHAARGTAGATCRAAASGSRRPVPRPRRAPRSDLFGERDAPGSSWRDCRRWSRKRSVGIGRCWDGGPAAPGRPGCGRSRWRWALCVRFSEPGGTGGFGGRDGPCGGALRPTRSPPAKGLSGSRLSGAAIAAAYLQRGLGAARSPLSKRELLEGWRLGWWRRRGDGDRGRWSRCWTSTRTTARR